MKNTISVTPNSTGIACTSLRRMYANRSTFFGFRVPSDAG
jgi:hypothetical protein